MGEEHSDYLLISTSQCYHAACIYPMYQYVKDHVSKRWNHPREW